jgi:hypothetical protein
MRPTLVDGGSAIDSRLERNKYRARPEARSWDGAPPARQKAAAPSPEGIMQLGWGFRGSKVLLSAVELDLFTELAAVPLDGETLRKRLRLHERGARDFFDALVALGMLRRCSGLYANTPETGFYLDRNNPSYIGGLLRLANATIYPNWRNLTEALRTGKPQSGVGEGEDLFDILYADPAAAVGFAEAMTGTSLPSAWALARRFPWDEYKTFIDIGAAEGAVPVTVAQAHPHLSGGGFDLPRVRPIFEAYVGRHGLADRLRFHSGDFFKDPLPSADVLVLGQILHDWNLEAKRQLLAKAYAALPEQGALVVYDQMIDDERRQNAAGLLTSLSMLVATQGGFDYTVAECTNWMLEAGFARIRHEHLSGPFSMMVGIK